MNRSWRGAVLLIPSALLLVACDNAKPITLNDNQKEYFGVWEHSSSGPNNITHDGMLLVFHSDSTVSYKRCTTRLNGHRYTAMPDMSIKQLTDTQLIVFKNLWVFDFDTEFEVNRVPYVENNETYMKIDGVTLRRLKDHEQSSHASWKCDSDDDK
jgi:hypothetical protein